MGVPPPQIGFDFPHWAHVAFHKRRIKGERVRYRVIVGGRGGGKSWAAAGKLIERAMLQPERVLMAREFQNSIRDSSKKLLEIVIDKMGVGAKGNGFFTVTDNEIRGKNGSVFIFMGLHGKENAIKSLEGVTLVWVEEAVTISQASLTALIPTIRRDDSEIWFTYNPRYPHDPIDKMFRSKDGPPPGALVLEVHHNDNPWFPHVLQLTMEYDRKRDPEKYAHIWEGAYLQHSEARIFKDWRQFDFDAPADAGFYFGADWGHARDPSVLVRCFIGRWKGEPYASAVIADPNGRYLFVDEEACKVGADIDELPSLFAGSDRRQPPRWENEFAHPGIPGALRSRITADSSRPETIRYMLKLGFDIGPAIKGNNSVVDGIEFLRNYDIVVHPRCKNLINELSLYNWEIDRDTGEIGHEAADKYNHVIDSLRYALEGVRRGGTTDYSQAVSAGRRIMADLGGRQAGPRMSDKAWLEKTLDPFGNRRRLPFSNGRMPF